MGVERVPAREVHRELTSNVLTSDEPSAASLRVLTRYGLRERWRDDPEATLRTLHEGLPVSGGEDRLFALAELSFEHAEKKGGRTWFVASAVYAWTFLFPGDLGERPGLADRRTRLAFDLYNRGLVEGLPQEGLAEIPAKAELPLPFGSIAIEATPEDFAWAGRPLRHLVPSADYRVRGLANRYRVAGIGAPMSGEMAPLPEGEVPGTADRYVLASGRVPVTLLLRLPEARRRLASGRLVGRLEAHYWTDTRTVVVEGETLPLELEISSALAHGLEGAEVWSFELRGFFSGSYEDDGPRLTMMHPWIRGRIPIVLVHGTASSPGRWADLVNEIANDPQLTDHFQIWLFRYNTGNPIAYSAALLRRTLREIATALDPEASDPALREMVLVGHSQGGLLVRMQATDPGTRFWEGIFGDTKPEEFRGTTRAILEEALLFEPSPQVGRVIYVSTPHRGSYLASFRLANLLASTLRLPAALVGVGVDVVTLDRDALRARRIERLPTSIDNMAPGNRFIEALGGIPPVAGIPGHSIIPVRGDPPPEGQSDGVVRYESAHLEGVASEKVVYHASHSVQGHPEAILEVKRILGAHLAQLPDVTDAPAAPPAEAPGL